MAASKPTTDALENVATATPSPKRANYGEIGTTGLKHTSGFVYDEFLRDLQGARAAKVYREISENSPIATGIILGYQNVASHLDWHIEENPEGSSAKDKAAFEFVKQAFEDMNESWDSVLSQALSEIVFGWSLHEIVYKKRDGKDSKFTDGKVGWKKFPIRGQESLYRWEITEHGDIEAMHQIDPVTGKQFTIPLTKALLFRTTELKNNPEGRSMLRGAYIPYQYLRRIQEYEAIGVERDLAGLPVAWVPNEWLTSSEPEVTMAVNKMTQMVKDVRRNEREGLVLPMMYEPDLTGAMSHNKALDFELLSSGGSRQFDTDKIITRYNQQIGMSFLADFLTLGHDGVGSLALGTAKLDLWIMVVDSLCKSIAEVFNRQAIKELLRLNGMSTENAPKLVYGDVKNVDLGVLGTFIAAIANAGLLTPDEGLETWLREQADMPPVDIQGGAPPAADKLKLEQDQAKLNMQSQQQIVDNGGVAPAAQALQQAAIAAKPKPGAPKPGSPAAKKPSSAAGK